MQKELKENWLKALRSGGYQQATGVLRCGETNGYCCLGVLCDVANPDGWDRDFESYDDADGNEIVEESPRYYHRLGDAASGNGDTLLTGEWADEQGLNSDLIEQLTKLNDTGNPFTFIADVIEAKVPVDA